VAHSAEVKYLYEFESLFETALGQESEEQLGTFGEITLVKKISRYCPFKGTVARDFWPLVFFMNPPHNDH
jgi:hypothetical protein